MVKKIKHFKLENFKLEELQKIEDEINAFTITHDVLDIKVTSSSCCNSFKWIMIYIVIYQEEE